MITGLRRTPGKFLLQVGQASKRFAGLLCVLGIAGAQTIAITAPAANANLNGFQYTLSCSASSITTLSYVQYVIDGEPGPYASVSEPQTCPSAQWNSYFVGNGPHTFVVMAYNAAGTVLAMSSAVTGNVYNWLPQQQCAFNTAPSGACGYLSATMQQTATMYLNTGLTSLPSVIGFKPATTIAIVQKGVTATNVGPSQNTTTGNLLVAYARWQSSTETITCTDTQQDSFSYGNVNHSTGPAFSGQFCYAANITGRSGNQVTITTSGGSAVSATHAWELTGALTSSPKDVDTAALTISGGLAVQSPGFTPSVNGEFILAGGTWAGSPTVTSGTGFTFGTEDSGLQSMVESATIATVGQLFGVAAVTATSANVTTNSISVYVDGFTNGVTLAGTCCTAQINTTLYPNAAHNIVIAGQGSNCAGCSNGGWSITGQVESQVTFVNGAAVQELHASVHDQPLCTTAQANCPTSVTLTGTLVNTDGTSSAATISSCVSSNTGVVVVSGTCTVTEAGAGATSVAMTDSTGRTRAVYFEVFTSPNYNVLPHLGSDSAIHTSYGTNSILLRSAFQSLGGLSPILPAIPSATCGSATPFSGSYNTQYGQAFAAAYQASGFNVFESGTGCAPQFGGQNQSTWQANQTSDAMNYCNLAAAYGMKLYLIPDGGWTRGTPQWIVTNQGPGAFWSPPAMQYMTNAFLGCAVGSAMSDEVTSSMGITPLQGVSTGGVKLGTNTVGSTLTCSGGSCSVPVGSGFSLNGASRFIITGSGNSSLDYNTSSGCAAPYSGSISGGVLSFTAGTLTATFTASGNPNLLIEPYVSDAFDSSGNSGPPDGSSTGPCPNYVHYTLPSLIRTWITNVTGHFPMAWPAAAASGIAGFGAWDNSGVADYGDMYWASLNSAGYLPWTHNLSDVLNSQLGTVRNDITVHNLANPFVVLSSAIINNYAFHGYTIAVTSCSGNTITTSTDHLLRNIAVVTRLTVSGSSGGACDGNYFVIAAPTSTTLTVANAASPFSSSGTGGTIAWQDGSTTPITGVGISNSVGLGHGDFQLSSCAAIKGKRGETFTVSGNSDTNVNSATFWYDWENLDACTQYNNFMLHVPNITASTGGTAQIIADDGFIMGRTWGTALSGPRSVFATALAPLLAGAAGTRCYGCGGGSTDPTLVSDRTVSTYENNAVNAQGQNESSVFNDTNLGDFQSGLSLITNYAYSQTYAYAVLNAQILTNRLKQYILQPRYPAPDCGQFVECAVRQDSSGNTILMMESFLDAPATISSPSLSPYLVSGQTIAKYVADWTEIQASTLSAGTTSDSTTCNPGCFVVYVFAQSGAATVLQQPEISALLADWPGATTLLVRYAYALFPFSGQSEVVPQVYNCGTGTCTLPVDRNIGPVYVQLQAVDVNGKVLATGGVDQL